MSTPPAKRQRTEDTLITRSTIWYKDGSVVLQAQATQFRVHWGVLSKNSPFFRDLQDLPQPPDQDTIEGCPVIQIPDSSVDFEHLLETLYDPVLLTKKALPFPFIAAYVRLGRKYDFKELLDVAVKRLILDYPSSLEEYDSPLQSRNNRTITPYPGISFDIITLTRENSLYLILPCAYYCAAIEPQASIFDGIPRGDNSSAVLSPMDQKNVVLGRANIICAQFHRDNTLGWLIEGTISESCRSATACARIRGKVLRRGTSTLLAFSKMISPSSLCSTCEQDFQPSITTGRQKMWDALPTYFGLPPWSELKNEM
ncbi:hypothetical protein C8J57DRAFT_1460590 [Mycena rebaudengoi]|nr:hypothetical protein C8J57DRAFT_1460590 [Mycena rebaudengoi]